MHANEQCRYKRQYQKDLTALKLQNMATTTRDIYARAVRRVVSVYDCCPDHITQDQYREHFVSLIDSHSWSTVNSDRAGLTFFFKHVLRTEWVWGDIVKPKAVKSLPDVITYDQVAALINTTREQRYETFFLCAFSMHLRLVEALSLAVQGIDAAQSRIHVRLGKGKKDRYVYLPQRTLASLRRYWATHRHPTLTFPEGLKSQQRYRGQHSSSINSAL